MIPILVPLKDCPIGYKLHKPHRWRGGFLWGTVYGCDGADQKWLDLIEVLEAGSKGKLTKEQANTYLENWG